MTGRRIRHPAHGHPLTFFDERKLIYLVQDLGGGLPNCSWCSRVVHQEESCYGCTICAFWIHVQCLGLPGKIQHPLHRGHFLTRRFPDLSSFVVENCKHCGWKSPFGIGFYRCSKQQCNFTVCPCCVGITPSIKYKGHKHALVPYKNVNSNIVCDSCHECCDPNSFLLRCKPCGFNVHYGCGVGPIFPATFQHEYHKQHPLSFTKYVPKDEIYWDDCYCDVCEEERHPDVPVYYCAECNFIAHVSCVVSEIVPSLEAEWSFFYEIFRSGLDDALHVLPALGGNWCPFFQAVRCFEARGPTHVIIATGIAKMITRKAIKESMEEEAEEEEEEEVDEPVLEQVINYNIKDSSSTMADVLNSATTYEKMEMKVILNAAEWEKITVATNWLNQQENWGSCNTIPYFDQAFAEFMAWVNGRYSKAEDTSEFFKKLEDKVISLQVEGAEYVVAERFAPILRDVLDNYPYFSADFILSPKVKPYFFYLLCWAIEEMRNTRANNITPKLLIKWCYRLKCTQLSGCKIEFAFDHWKRLALAYFVGHFSEYLRTVRSRSNWEKEKAEEKLNKLIETRRNVNKSHFGPKAKVVGAGLL